ncbi:hypothetical protein EB231_33155 [Mesorhizobium sp. NZP2298]|nr:hypothetical protein EB231_33155 [Mesorhizobium sp. NZP2298]
MCSNSQFICIRRPARTCVLPVPRGPDPPSLAKPDDRTNDGTENNMPDNGFVESFNSRLRDESLNERLFTSYRHARKVSKNGRSITTRCARMGRSGTRPRSRCSIPMAPPARHREKAGKLHLPAVQRMVSEQKWSRLESPLDDSSGAGHERSLPNSASGKPMSW